jgi:hypothetical protein
MLAHSRIAASPADKAIRPVFTGDPGICRAYGKARPAGSRRPIRAKKDQTLQPACGWSIYATQMFPSGCKMLYCRSSTANLRIISR